MVGFVAVKGRQKEYYQFDKMDFSREGIIHKNAIRFLLEKKEKQDR